VGRGIKTSIKELTELILKITGSDLPIEYEPAGQTFVTNRLGDPAAAERDLGFKCSVNLEEGLTRLISWRKENIKEVNHRRKQAGIESQRKR
jgi:UDP-glucose 4-epimerase